ncbi:hypothetical protein AAEO50_04305 [Rossellomorea oryzaecorticis]|uniref:NlpC/P60 domain-containing protein n=1 Tax=Rossellomorea oryzaecorticis TaxID=1396505 RepID=A0ABU9K8E5_9BACI
MNINGYRLNTGTLTAWGKRLIPDLEWFFFVKMISGVEMNPLQSLDRSSMPLDIRTSYATWALSNETEYYARMSQLAFSNLAVSLQSEIIRQQWTAGRGLVFELEELIELAGVSRDSLPGVSIDDNKEIVLLHRPVWETFTVLERHRFLVNYGALWVNEAAHWDKVKKDNQTSIKMKYPHILEKIDEFPKSNGPNCLAAVAAALTRNEAFFYKWMKEEEFMGVIKEANYEPFENERIEEGDVLIWFNDVDQITHSCFVLNNELAFNKQGQTMFNPWQVLKLADIIKSWELPGIYFIPYRKHQ